MPFRILYILLSLIFAPFLLNAQSSIRIPPGTTIHTKAKSGKDVVKQGVLKEATYAKVVFKNDKILIRPMENTISVTFTPSDNAETLNITKDDEVYLDMSDTAPFNFSEISFGVSIVSIPLIFRLEDKSNQEIAPTGQWGVTNASFMLGVNADIYKYNGVLRTTSFTIGPYVGPTIIRLNPNNSNAVDEIDKVGLTTGLAVTFGENRFNLGVAFGAEIIPKEQSLDWIYRNQMYFGFLAGFRIY